MRRAEYVEPRPNAPRLYGIIGREAVSQLRRHFSDIGESISRRRTLRRAEKLENPAKLDPAVGMLIPRKLQTTQSHAKRGQCCIPPRFEFLGQKIVAIFRPTKPDLVDLEFVK